MVLTCPDAAQVYRGNFEDVSPELTLDLFFVSPVTMETAQRTESRLGRWPSQSSPRQSPRTPSPSLTAHTLHLPNPNPHTHLGFISLSEVVREITWSRQFIQRTDLALLNDKAIKSHQQTEDFLNFSCVFYASMMINVVVTRSGLQGSPCSHGLNPTRPELHKSFTRYTSNLQR